MERTTSRCSDYNQLQALSDYAKEICKYLPRYIVVYGCKSLADIINTCIEDKDDNKELFAEYTKCSFDTFEKIVKANVINEDGINDVITMFWEEYNKVIKMDALSIHNFQLRWNIFND